MGISFSTVEENKAWHDKGEFPFTLVSDPETEVGTLYGVLRDPDDRFAHYSKRHSYLIRPDGIIEKAYDVSDPAGHAAEVLADLAAINR